MPKLKLGVIRTLVHERLVSVEIDEETSVMGVAFAQGETGQVLVCLRKIELEAAGLSSSGPCINRFYPKAKITYLDSSKMPIVEEEEDEYDDNSDRGDNPEPTGDLLDNTDNENIEEEKGAKRKKRKPRKKKVK